MPHIYTSDGFPEPTSPEYYAQQQNLKAQALAMTQKLAEEQKTALGMGQALSGSSGLVAGKIGKVQPSRKEVFDECYVALSKLQTSYARQCVLESLRQMWGE